MLTPKLPRLRFMRTPALMAVLVTLGAVAPAQAAITVGNNLTQDPSSTVTLCTGDDTTCTIVPKTLIAENRAPGGLVAVPGVVVRWRVKSEERAAGVSIALRVVRDETGLGRSNLEVMTSQAPPVFTYATRLPVAAGDRLGLDMVVANGASSARIAASRATVGSWDRWQPALGVGETRRRDNDKPYELLLNADIEPDADADGWGDESQDRCTGTAGPLDGCAPPAVPPSPSVAPPGSGANPVPTSPGTSGPGAQDAIEPSLARDDGRPPQITALQFNATRLRFRISERATVSLAVQRVTPGRSVLGRCVRPTRSNSRYARCLRLVSVLSGKTNVLPGLNTAKIRRLAPGRYRVRLMSTDRAGRRGRTLVRYFRLSR